MEESNGHTIQICQQLLDLEFRDLYFTANAKHGQASREILHGVSGKFRAGRLTAILGPSGAGKTSLLNVLSGFRTIGVTGSVRVNGLERVPQAFRKECCYISQEFAMLGLLTVYETFRTTTDLKLGTTVSAEKKLRVIHDVADILNIRSCLNTQVRYLSGGEKKRLSIGLELVTNPPIMLFDEPTSGLDSSSSIQVVNHLKNLARGGRTVVCVIHQPSSKLFEMFDDVLVVVDGRTLYNGSVEEMVPLFEAAGHHCPNYYNRADFVIEIACQDDKNDLESLYSLAKERFRTQMADTQIKERSNGEVFPPQVEALEPMLPGEFKYPKSTKIQILPMSKPRPSSLGNFCCSKVKYAAPIWYQFWVLLKRSFLCSCIRDLHMAQIRFGAQILVGLLMGTVFYNFGDDATKVPSNMSYLFFSLMFIFFSNAMPTVQTFPMEAAVFFREHLNNWYSMRSYYFSKLVADLPMQIICPTVYMSLTYFMTNQPMEIERLLKVVFLGILVTIMAQALGQAFGAAFDAQLGTFLIPASAIPMFLFSGFFILLSELHYTIRWLSYVSYFRYPFEGLMMATYGEGRRLLQCPLPYCPGTRPDKILMKMDLHEGNYWIDIGGIVAWIVVLRLIFLCILKWKLYRKRGY